MPRVVRFELATEQPEWAADFYQAVFGWVVEKWRDFDYWLVTTGSDAEPGINGGLMLHQDARPRTVNLIEVDSIDPKIMDAGGRLVTDKVTVPGVGYTIYCTRNLFGLHQPDTEAK